VNGTFSDLMLSGNKPGNTGTEPETINKKINNKKQQNNEKGNYHSYGGNSDGNQRNER
jgi:hypothetical protein